MNISIKQLKAFVAVAETHSFIEACGRINLSQPALSISIKNLEAEIGGKLLARSTRTLALTPEGEEFLPVATRLLADWGDALEDLNNLFTLQRGRLSVAAMPSFASTELPKTLVEFRNLHPGVNITVHDVIAENVVEMVREGRVEVGITFEPPSSKDLEFQPLFIDKFVAALPPKHKLLKKKNIEWKILAENPFIALQRPSSIRERMDQNLEEENIKLSVEFEAHQLATIGRMVANGLGVSAVPSLCIEQMKELGVECRALIAPNINRPVGIITRSRYPLSTAAEAMFNVMVKHFK